MNGYSITRLIFDTIPQLYVAPDGPYSVEFSVPGETSKVFTAEPLSPALQKYIETSAVIWQDIKPLTEGDITQVIEREWIQQKFVIGWLNQQTKVRSWGRALDYFRRLSRRTTENKVVSKTVVIEPGGSVGTTARLTDQNYFKVLDWLGSSAFTFYRVDEQLGIKALEAISLSDIGDSDEYRFYPDVLHPVIANLKDPDSAIIHMTENGSILVANREGVLASKRPGESWTIYDREHIVSSLASLMQRQITGGLAEDDPYCVACSLFQILFDISIKRHGGLLIVDRPENLSRYVMGGIKRDRSSPLDSIFTHSPFNGLNYSAHDIRKLVELSAIDGALILDLEGNLARVGAMVISHPEAMNQFGARDMAAFSAAKNGATAFKISSDGEISLYFTTPEYTGDSVYRFVFH